MVNGVRLMVLSFRLMVNGPTFSLYLGDVWHSPSLYSHINVKIFSQK
jgi:hypothetical protein